MIREAPPKQLRQAAYATQPADAAGPDTQMITMPPGVYIIKCQQGCILSNATRGEYYSPKQLHQAAYATQPADAAGPNAQMITMPPGVYIFQCRQGVYVYHSMTQGRILYDVARGVYYSMQLHQGCTLTPLF